jgi:hypothetical protein
MNENNDDTSSHVLKIYEDLLSNKDISKHFADNFQIECLSRLFKCKNLKDFQETYKNIKKGLPDFTKTQLFSSSKDDKIFVLYRCSGTHTGESVASFPPTNRKGEWYSSSVYTIKNGLITNLISVSNELDICKQLGWDVSKLN